MSRQDTESLDQLGDKELSTLVARGAHLLQERGINLQLPVPNKPIQHSESILNPFTDPSVLPLSVFGDGRIIIDHALPNIVRVDGKDRHLTPLRFDVLALLAANAGKIVPHTYMLKTIWPDFSPERYHHRGMSPSTKISGVLHHINKVLGTEDLGHPTHGAIRLIRSVGHTALINRDLKP